MIDSDSSPNLSPVDIIGKGIKDRYVGQEEIRSLQKKIKDTYGVNVIFNMDRYHDYQFDEDIKFGENLVYMPESFMVYGSPQNPREHPSKAQRFELNSKNLINLFDRSALSGKHSLFDTQDLLQFKGDINKMDESNIHTGWARYKMENESNRIDTTNAPSLAETIFLSLTKPDITTSTWTSTNIGEGFKARLKMRDDQISVSKLPTTGVVIKSSQINRR